MSSRSDIGIAVGGAVVSLLCYVIGFLFLKSRMANSLELDQTADQTILKF